MKRAVAAKRIRRLRRNGQELVILSYAVVVPARGNLTKAEGEVARLVVKGMSNRQIANARATKERTVANQLKSIFQKLSVQSRVELVMLLV